MASNRKEATCALCGKLLGSANVVEKVDGVEYAFDKKECVILFKKFESVYGTGFCTS